MKRIIITLLTGLLGLLFLIGCERDTSSAISDQQLEDNAIADILTNEDTEDSDYVMDWGIDDGDEKNMYNGYSTFSGGSPFPKILTPIDSVVRFGRILNRRIPRNLVIRRVSPDTIWVYMERVWGGQFISLEKLDADTFVVHRKQLVHNVKRTAIFTKRIGDQNALRDPRRRWKLSAVSMGFGTSRPAPTVEIHQIDIATSSGDSYTFTDPLQTIFNLPENLPVVAQGEVVTIQVLVSNNSSNPVIDPETGATETLLLHFGLNRFHRARRQFEYKGVDPATGHSLFEGSWTVHEPAFRPFHAIVDAIDNGTIYDDDEQTYPYNSMTWGFPYRVVIEK
jgi:hypothetical protein